MAVAEYEVSKRAPGDASEALECFGGNGYVEASGMPRLYRESPLTSIWEDSGNVWRDALRAIGRSPEALDAFFAEVDSAAGADPRLDDFAVATRAEVSDLEATRVPRPGWSNSWRCACRAPSWSGTTGRVADAFCAARLAGDWGLASAPCRRVPTLRPSLPGTRRRCSAASLEREAPDESVESASGARQLLGGGGDLLGRGAGLLRGGGDLRPWPRTAQRRSRPRRCRR